MDKKTYIAPTALTVMLSPKAGLLQDNLSIISDDEITDEDEILTKEHKNINVWDEEW